MQDPTTCRNGSSAGLENPSMPLLNKFLSKKPENTLKEFTEATSCTNKSTVHKFQHKSPSLKFPYPNCFSVFFSDKAVENH
jgi:hypothetical protein